MKRLADFVVDRHKAVIAVTLILTLICGGLALLVRVNTDLTEYLPDDSGMKIGMDVMDEEFPGMDDVYTLRVMFRGLPEERRLPLREELAGIPYVDEVEYEAGDADYNRGDYTLFVVQTKYDFDTAEERAVERVLTEEFAGYEMVFVRDAIEPAEVPPVLILLALALMLAVLTVMSSSWLEPFLFLASLGIAVALNMGTNFFLGTISEVSASIGYLLQMILSLDYSIMLLTRYRQEPDVRENKYAAMKNALVHSFSSIAASAMTTVAGLLVLVFMRFKIGKDLGIVLAKGVFLSMLCSFVFLPGVIILCDRWLEKTAKKALSVKMNAIAAFSGRFRYAIVVFFILLFTGAALWQGQTEITFVLEDPDPVAEVFPEINSMVVLFDNADEARVAELTEQLKSNDHILSAASFSSTLGKPFTAAELSDELRDMDGMDPGDLDIDSLRMLYYYYYKGEETGAIDAGDFLGFIADDVAQNEMFSERLDAEIRDHLDMLSVFADAGRLTQARAAADLADILEMEASDVADILVYYFAERGGADPGTMTLPDFVGFIRNEVLSDEEYADLFDAETLDQIDTLATLTDRAEITQPKDAAGIADVLEMERGDADLLLLYYYAKQGAADGVALTFPEFTRLLLDDCFNDERFAGAIDEETRRDAEKLEVLADPEEFRRREPMDAIAGKLDMDSGQAGLLAALYFAGEGAADDYALTVPEFIATVLEDILNDGRFAGSFTEDEREDMERLAVFADPEDFGRPENLTALAGKLGMDGDQAKLLAALYFADAGEMDRETLTLERFVRVLVEQMMEDERMARFFDDETRDSMEDLRFFCSRDDVLARYSAGEAADRLGIPAETARLLFAYYYAANQTVTPGNIPLGEFVRFLTDIGGDANFAGMFGEEQRAQMALLAMFTDPGVLLAEYGPADMGRTLAGLGMAQASVDAVYAMTAADVMTLSDFMDILAQAGEGA
ncbi:MAG: MMPL family transporter, partial [Peptococcaceae bacterium]|nr:MMPL family transporter [Peptococcaceae bacterium]